MKVILNLTQVLPKLFETLEEISSGKLTSFIRSSNAETLKRFIKLKIMLGLRGYQLYHLKPSSITFVDGKTLISYDRVKGEGDVTGLGIYTTPAGVEDEFNIRKILQKQIEHSNRRHPDILFQLKSESMHYNPKTFNSVISDYMKELGGILWFT